MVELSRTQAAAERVPALAVHTELLDGVQQLPLRAQVALQPQHRALAGQRGPDRRRLHILAGPVLP